MALPHLRAHQKIVEKQALIDELVRSMKTNSYQLRAPDAAPGPTIDDQALAVARGESIPGPTEREMNGFRIADENFRRRQLIDLGIASAERALVGLKAEAFKEIEPAVRARHEQAVKGIAEAVLALAKANQVEEDLAAEIHAAGYSPLGIERFEFGRFGRGGTFSEMSQVLLDRIDREFGTKFFPKLAK